MHKIKNFGVRTKDRIKGWSLTKKIIYGLLVVVLGLILFKILGPEDNSKNITTDFVKKGNLQETILATGQVTSSTDLNLSFAKSGTVRSLRVKVGDKVRAGTIMATLEQGNELAALTSARGSVAAAEARYKKILAGSTTEEVRLSEIALENAKKDQDRIKSQQDILVNNAYTALLNSTPEARPAFGSYDYKVPTVSGNYNKGIEGDIKISTYQSVAGYEFVVSGIVSGRGTVTTTNSQPIGDSGLLINFSGVDLGISREWIISIPNEKAANYVTNYNSYQAALKTRESALGSAQAIVDQRTAELALKKAAAPSADVELAEADILSAKGNYQAASANYENTILRAPVAGTVTKIDIKLGELAAASKPVITVQDVGNLYLEANVNEANVANIKNNASVELSFDAFGTDNLFTGRVLTVDPSSTLISGVVNYKVTASIDSSPTLRPGMTANMTILVDQKNDILMVPQRAVLTKEDGSKVVRVVINPKTKKFEEVRVTTGMEGDGGLVEVTSGLKEGDEVVVLIKK